MRPAVSSWMVSSSVSMPLHGRAVALGQLHVGGSEAVGRGLAGEVLEALDVLVILADGEGGVDVAVGSGEVVGLGALFGDFDAVADEVVAASVQTGNRLSQSLSTYSGSTPSFSAMARETSTS